MGWKLFGIFPPKSPTPQEDKFWWYVLQIFFGFTHKKQNARSKKSHTKNNMSVITPCAFGPCLHFGQPKADEFFDPFWNPFSF